jgi:hypothetical protein
MGYSHDAPQLSFQETPLVGQGALFLAGTTAFTIYVMLNFHHEATIASSTPIW